MQRNRKLAPLVLAVAFLVLAVPVFAGTVTFSEPGLVPGLGPFGTPTGTYLTTQLAPMGVLFSTNTVGGNAGHGYVSNSTYIPGIPTTPPSPFSGQFLTFNTVETSTGKTNVGPATTLTITFVSPTDPTYMAWVLGSTMWFHVNDTERNYTITAFDLAGNQLQQFSAPSGSDFATIQFTTTAFVHRITLLDVGADGLAIDNFNYGDILTPEPGTFALLGLGLIGLGMALRRKRT